MARAPAPSPYVRIDVLGPLRLHVDGVEIGVPGPKRRALLAVLAMAGGRVVSAEHLVDALWPGDQPAAARASLYSHVSRLRRHLGAAADILDGRDRGYVLVVDADRGTDVACVRTLLGMAGGAPPAEARDLLRQARGLWRGEPLAEFPDVSPLTAWVPALGELRRQVDEAYAAAALEAGSSDEAAAVSGALAVADPFSESAALLRIRALHALGRGAEALRVGYEYRRRLRAETGLDPTPALAQLEQAVAGAATGQPPVPVVVNAGPLRGRDPELAEVLWLLTHRRLVTILGAGGIGKTRLAMEAAARIEPATVLLLAPIPDSAAVPRALTDALDLRVHHDDLLGACAALLAAGPRLLLIDNCEHVLSGVRDAVTTLLTRCPELTVLATSRRPLGLTAEHCLRLRPLAVGAARPSEAEQCSPAAAVFLDRARGVRPDIVPGSDEMDVIEQIVRRLDGIPLAIELAAGRLSSMALLDVHARLDRSLDLLGDDHGTTLRRTVAWSYELLPDPARRLFRYLGTFADGFDLMAAEFVADRLALPGDAAAALLHLVDASLVELVETAAGAPPRYRLLNPIRTFARDRLRAEGQESAGEDCFLAWARHVVAEIEGTVETVEEVRADVRLRREALNLRSAWVLSRRLDRLKDALALVIGTETAAGWRDLPEIWAWSLELAEDPAVAGHPAAPVVYGIAAGSAWARGELQRAHRLAVEGLVSAGGDDWRCRGVLALVALGREDFATAISEAAAAAAAAPRPEQSWGIAALAAAYGGSLGTAAMFRDRLAAIAVAPTLVAFSHYVTAEIEAVAGATDRAEENYEAAIALARGSGATFVAGIASVGLMTSRERAGRMAEALAGYRELIGYWERTGGWVQQWTTLRNLARLLGVLGDRATALRLVAAADAAPEAPPDGDPGGAVDPGATTAGVALQGAEAAGMERSTVLQLARRAIARHLAAEERRAPRNPRVLRATEDEGRGDGPGGRVGSSEETPVRTSARPATVRPCSWT
jgi:predicted ATPase/DNA-binding SARP family transcriptional activator